MFTPNSHRITGLTNSITSIVQCDALQQLQSYDEHLSSLCGTSRIRKRSALEVFAAPSTTLFAAHGVDTPSNTEPNLILRSGSLASFGVGYFGGRSKAENQKPSKKTLDKSGCRRNRRRRTVCLANMLIIHVFISFLADLHEKKETTLKSVILIRYMTTDSSHLA